MKHLGAFLLSLGTPASARTGAHQGCLPRIQVGEDPAPQFPGESASFPGSVIKSEKSSAPHETPQGLE